MQDVHGRPRAGTAAHNGFMNTPAAVRPARARTDPEAALRGTLPCASSGRQVAVASSDMTQREGVQVYRTPPIAAEAAELQKPRCGRSTRGHTGPFTMSCTWGVQPRPEAGDTPARRAIRSMLNPRPRCGERRDAVCASTRQIMHRRWKFTHIRTGVNGARSYRNGLSAQNKHHGKPAMEVPTGKTCTSRRAALRCPCRRLPSTSASRHLALAFWCCAPTQGVLPIVVCMSVAVHHRWGSHSGCGFAGHKTGGQAANGALGPATSKLDRKYVAKDGISSVAEAA